MGKFSIIRMVAEVNLHKTSWHGPWTAFRYAMFALWGIVLLYTIIIYKSRRAIRHIKVILFLMFFICLLRIPFFVDPRGWANIYPDIVFELLLQIAFCLMISQWIFIVQSWWQYRSIHKQKGFKKMLNNVGRWKFVFFFVYSSLVPSFA
eukprot:c7583_g1_i1.p1 GENE.c7583_g1_i1~~c7583_g1_i1.p1  ORF type:complete len:149 (-),score=19.61 c7583_g1_i1:428-874(-)